jgi:F-type H+-transporting ATPase subunit delta
MAMSYQDIYRREKHIMLGKVTSVTPLPPAVLDKLKQLIDQHYNAELQMSTATDPKLIGGFVLEVGNSRFDASVRTELKQIRETLMVG